MTSTSLRRTRPFRHFWQSLSQLWLQSSDSQWNCKDYWEWVSKWGHDQMDDGSERQISIWPIILAFISTSIPVWFLTDAHKWLLRFGARLSDEVESVIYSYIQLSMLTFNWRQRVSTTKGAELTGHGSWVFPTLSIKNLKTVLGAQWDKRCWVGGSSQWMRETAGKRADSGEFGGVQSLQNDEYNNILIH